MTHKYSIILIAALAAIFAGSTAAQADTTFTYQGELKNCVVCHHL